MTRLDICNTSYDKKKGQESKLAILTPNHKKSGIDTTSMRVGGVRYAIGKL